MIKNGKKLGAGVVSAFVGSLMALTMQVGTANAQQSAPQGWFKVCTQQEANEICNTQIRSVASTGQVITGISLIQIKGGINRSLFQVTVPSGRVIPAGIKVSIDGKPGTTLPYLYCFPQRCMAEVQLDNNLIALLKAGGSIVATSTNFQGKENPIQLTLSGFTAAFDGPPLKQNELQDQNQQLQDKLREKAEAARKKLQEAQDAAKN